MTQVQQFVSGAIGMGYAVAGLFFLKFWWRTHDALFVTFALAIWMLAALRIVQSSLAQESELQPLLYSVRLVAYGLILWGILQKNRRMITPGSETRLT